MAVFAVPSQEAFLYFEKEYSAGYSLFARQPPDVDSSFVLSGKLEAPQLSGIETRDKIAVKAKIIACRRRRRFLLCLSHKLCRIDNS